MPLYEFECKVCSEVSKGTSLKEILLRSPSEHPVCPDCGSDRLDRIMSATATPAMGGRLMPVSGGADSGEACGMPRCCGGGCQM